MVSRPGQTGPNDELPDNFAQSAERATNPDIGASKIQAPLRVREQVRSACKCIEREREIISSICSADNLHLGILKRMRSANSGGKITFAEYRCSATGVAYVYLTPESHAPSYIDSMGQRVPLANPEGTILLRVEWGGDITEIERWED